MTTVMTASAATALALQARTLDTARASLVTATQHAVAAPPAPGAQADVILELSAAAQALTRG